MGIGERLGLQDTLTRDMKGQSSSEIRENRPVAADY
jgi:hypothetical protein